MIEFLINPFLNTFMQRALLELVLISIIAGLIGTFLVLKNTAFISEGLSHGVYPGIVLSFVFGVSNIVGAMIVGVLSIVGITLTSRDKKISANNSIVIFFTTLFAIGIIIRGLTVNTAASLSEFLIGNILGVSAVDIIITFIFTIVLVATFVILYKKFVITAFDKEYADALGINTNRLDLLMNIFVAITVVISIQAVGNILVIALLIIPAITARLLVKQIDEMIYLTILLSLISSIVGLYLSYYLNIPTGATIILVLSSVFFITFALKRILGKN